MSAKKKTKRKNKIDRPFCGGEWSLARFRSFAMSALRQAKWAPRFKVISRAFVRKGVNPATGKPCKLHKCEECGGEFPQGKMRADHVHTVIPLNHDWESNPDSFLGYNWNEVMRRLWIEEGNGWNVICETCHKAKTKEEREERAATKKQIEEERKRQEEPLL